MTGPLLPTARSAMSADGFMNQIGNLNLDKMLAQLRGYDPDGIDRAVEQAQLAREKIAQAAARVLETPDGQLVLEWLLDQTLRRPMIFPGHDRDQRAAFISHREGENAIMWLLLQMFAEGRKETLPPRESQP